MTDTMLERMARAIGESSPTISPVSDWVDFLPCAKAALQAIREPDKSIIVAMDAESYPDSGSYTRWQAGIDAILSGDA